MGRKHIYLPHAQTAIYDSKVKLFLKQGISRQLGRGWTQLFDLNARIQQLTWSLIFYEKYSTSQSYLWFWPLLILGGFSNFCRYYTRSQTGKSTGYRPIWNPWYSPIFSLNCICCHLISRTILSISNSMQFILNHIYYPQIFPLKIWKLSKELFNFKTKTMPFPLPNWVVHIHCRSRCAVECKQTQSGYANYPLRTVFFWKYLTLIIKSKW